MSFAVDGATPNEAAEKCGAWADIDGLRAMVLVPWDPAVDVPLRFGRHELFEPWRDQIQRTAALEGAIVFGDPAGEEPVSRAGGAQAWLSQPDAPSCERCGKLLTFCFQITSADLAPWLSTDGLLTGAYCFECHPESARHYDFRTRQYLDGAQACRITVEQPRHLVTMADAGEPARKLGFTRRWSFPNLAYSYERFGDGAATQMWKWDIEPRVEVANEYLAMVNERHGWKSPHVEPLGERLLEGEVWRTTLGGFPSWDQEDVTPDCADCGAPMQLALDYNGHQFLDGSLHVFTCVQAGACRDAQRFDFVAEF